ncbi:MAG: CHASE domain-containing protein [Planctomycetes bacterium]|nr:CHASE domain-containing protein [Planctomycetota bacterium]
MAFKGRILLRENRDRKRSYLPTPQWIRFILTICIGFLLTAVAFIAIRNVNAHKQLVAFERASITRLSTLRRGIENKLGVVEEVGAFMAALNDPTRQQFREAVRLYLSRDPAIQSLYWVPRVPDSQRASFVEAARKDGFPDFQFTERRSQGDMARTGRRDVYFPVYYLEPYEGNEIVLGFDNASNRKRAAALSSARDTAEIVGTPRIPLVQETDSQFGFLVFLPIFVRGAAISSREERRENIRGFVSAVLRIDTIVEQAVATLKPVGIDLHLYDMSAPMGQNYLSAYSSRMRKTPMSPIPDPAQIRRDSMHHATSFDVAGREWMLVATPAPEFIAAHRDTHSWWVILGGLLITGLVSGLLLSDSYRATRLGVSNLHLANEITERSQIEETLRLVVEGTSSVVGAGFYQALVQRLASVFTVRFAFVSRFDPLIEGNAQLLAMWEKDGFAEPFEYDMRGTPCEQVAEKNLCYFAAGVQALFPEDRWLQEAGIESYLAIRLLDSASNPIGHLGVMDTEPMSDVGSRVSILHVFAARAAAELERESAEKRLLASERGAREQFAQLEVLYNEAPLGLCHMDTDLRFLRCNDKLAEINGIPAADHIGRSLREIIPEIAKTVESVYREVIESGEAVVDVEATGATAADPENVRHFSACYYPIKSEDGVVIGVSSIVQDITERKQSEELLHLREVKLAHFSRLSTMGEMAIAIAHELNQPLAAIMNFTGACRRRLRAGHGSDEDLAHSLERISSMAERAGQIIRGVKGLFRKREPHRSTADMNELIRDAVGLVTPEARFGGIEIKLELEDHLPPVMVDVIQIQQVVLNLIRNGVDAMRDAGNGRQVIVIQTMVANGEEVEVAVADRGSGIATAVSDRLFEPFVSTKTEGLGMGLSISRSIVDAHGGRLWVDANSGPGVTFRFVISCVGAARGR